MAMAMVIQLQRIKKTNKYIYKNGRTQVNSNRHTHLQREHIKERHKWPSIVRELWQCYLHSSCIKDKQHFNWSEIRTFLLSFVDLFFILLIRWISLMDFSKILWFFFLFEIQRTNSNVDHVFSHEHQTVSSLDNYLASFRVKDTLIKLIYKICNAFKIRLRKLRHVTRKWEMS